MNKILSYEDLKRILRAEFGDNPFFKQNNHPIEFNDLFNDTYIVILDKFDSSKGKLLGFAYTVFRNKLLNIIKRESFVEARLSDFNIT